MTETLPYQQLENNLIHLITSNLESKEMLTKIAQELGKSFSVSVCLIIPKLEQKYEKNLYSWQSDQQFQPEKIKNIPLKEIANLDLFAISNLQENQLNTLFQDWGLSALLISNTHSYKGINGVVILGEYQPYNWTENEIISLKKISYLIALALRLCQLQNEAKLSNQYETILKEIGGTLLQTSSLNSLFSLALEATIKALEIDRGLILTLKYNNPLFKKLGSNTKPQGKAEIICQSHHNKTNKKSLKKEHTFNLSEAELILAALEKAPTALTIDNIEDYKNLLTVNSPIIYDPTTTKSLLFVPIMGSMASEIRTPIILGLIVLQDNKPHPWSNQELQLVNWVSVQLSINMLHNQSLSRVQSLVEERTSQLKWSLDVQAKLSEKMRQQLEELQQLNQLKDDFLSSMSHELNTPLTTMKMAIKMLRQFQSDPERQAKYLDILEQEWNREYSLIKDLLTLQQVESNKLNIQPQEVSLNKIIEHLATDFRRKWSEDKGLTLKVNYEQISCNLQVYLDPHSLEQIIAELLLNAGKYATPHTEVEILASRKMTPEGYQIILQVTNQGWGISSEEKRYIFDKFRRGKGTTDSAIPGTGLGLTMVKSLVDYLAGNIEVESFSLDNSSTFKTSFTVTLPQSLI